MGVRGVAVRDGSLARAAIRYRAVQKRSLFSALALAVQKQMPLVPMALAFADEQEGSFALRARELAELLEHGVSLPESLRRLPGTLPPESALAASIGMESGDLAGALHATTYGSVFDRTLVQAVVARGLYLILVVMFLVTVLSFMQIKILPAWIKIYDDFGTVFPQGPLAANGPLDGQWAEAIVDDLAFGWLPTAPVMTAKIAVYMILATMMATLVVSWILLYVWLQWRGTLVPRMPGLRRIIRWVDMGPVLRVLALATRLGRPLPGMIYAIAKFHPKRYVRNRMWAVMRDIDSGQAWQESLRRRRLIGATDAAILSAAERSGNLNWALGQMAESFERKAGYRLQAQSQLVAPLLILPLGILIALVAVSYFIPLSMLIRSLS